MNEEKVRCICVVVVQPKETFRYSTEAIRRYISRFLCLVYDIVVFVVCFLRMTCYIVSDGSVWSMCVPIFSWTKKLAFYNGQYQMEENWRHDFTPLCFSDFSDVVSCNVCSMWYHDITLFFRIGSCLPACLMHCTSLAECSVCCKNFNLKLVLQTLPFALGRTITIFQLPELIGRARACFVNASSRSECVFVDLEARSPCAECVFPSHTC